MELSVRDTEAILTPAPLLVIIPSTFFHDQFYMSHCNCMSLFSGWHSLPVCSSVFLNNNSVESVPNYPSTSSDMTLSNRSLSVPCTIYTHQEAGVNHGYLQQLRQSPQWGRETETEKWSHAFSRAGRTPTEGPRGRRRCKLIASLYFHITLRTLPLPAYSSSEKHAWLNLRICAYSHHAQE